MPGPLIAGIVGSVASAGIQSATANKAAGAQKAAADDQIAESRRQFDLMQALLKPYVSAGNVALQGQLDLMGIGGGGGVAPSIQTNTIAGSLMPNRVGSFRDGRGVVSGIPGSTNYTVDGQTFATMQEAQNYANAHMTGGVSAQDAQRAAIDNLANGSQFKALADQGEYALLANAGATGGLRGGDTQSALAQFRPQMLQSLIQQQLAGLGGIAANGQNAAAQTGQAAQNSAQQVNAALGDKGSAQAGAALAGGQAWANAGSGILQTLGGLAQPLTPGGGAWQKWSF